MQPVDEGSGHAAADDAADARAPDAEQNVESAQRDWMHRLRPGDIVLVSGVSFCASDEFNAIVEVACFQIRLNFCVKCQPHSPAPSSFQIQLQRSEAIKGAIPDAVRCSPFLLMPPPPPSKKKLRFSNLFPLLRESSCILLHDSLTPRRIVS